MNKIIKRIVIIIVVVILFIILSIYFLNTQKMENEGYTLSYMNSDDISSSTKSPTNIHVVLAKYIGDVKPKTISKFSYNFAYNIIPNYVKLIEQGKLKENDRFFYFNNKKLILIQTGIDNYDEFNNLIKKISVLSGELEIENVVIPIASIDTSKVEFESEINIKYKNNEELKFKLVIGKNSDNKMTGIKIF